MSAESESTSRLGVLRKLLGQGRASTQEELRDYLKKEGFDVTQSTVSRDLRRLEAIKAIDTDGQTVYRLSEDAGGGTGAAPGTLGEMVIDITSNGSIIVIHTTPGSASLVARHLDRVRPGGILGTLAGDDTIFVAPANLTGIKGTVRAISESLAGG